MPTNEESPDLRLSDGQPLVTRLTETIFSAKATQLTEQTVVETSAEVIERISNPEHEKRSARGVFVSNQINQASVGANGNVVLAKVTSEVRVICPEDVFGSTSKAVRDEGHENWSIDETTVLALGPFQGRSSQHEPKEAQNDDVDDVDLDHVSGGQTCTQLNTGTNEQLFQVAQNHHLYSRSADGLQYHQAAINGNEDTSKLAISKPANESGLSDVLDGGTKRYQVYKSRDQINRTSKPENHDEVEKEDIPLEELLMEAEQGESPGEFVPLSELERIVNKKAVEARLVETFPNTDKRTISHMAEKVCLGSSKPTDQGQPQPVAAKSYRRVFAILAHLNKLAELPDFLDDAGGISDDELPLRRIKRKGARRLFDLRTKNNSSRICFNGWGAVEIKNFYLYQWVVLAPFFDPGEQKPISNYILHNETRLPFTSIGKLNDNDGSFHRGGFAKVYKVAIHPSHHAFDDPDVSPVLSRRLLNESK
jgi:hypothetical protein